MKRTLALILSLMMLCTLFSGLSAGAYPAGDVDLAPTGSYPTSGTTGDCTWSYDRLTATLTIGGSGEMADYTYNKYQGKNDAPWSDWYRSIENVVIGDSVTYIGKEAFYHVFYLTNVKLGKRVKTIGKRAFGLDRLESVAIPDSAEVIGDEAFSGSEDLQTVKLGKKVKTIGESAFKNCNLDGVKIPDSVQTIGAGAFSSNVNLKSLTIGKGVQTIGASAFENCGIQRAVIPANVQEIGEYALGFRKSEEDGRVPVPGFIIYGDPGSYAQAYAIANAFPFKNMNSYEEDYALWVGATQVTSRNKDDIFRDGGKAKFDPTSGILTLKNAKIKGNDQAPAIYCEQPDLTVKGKGTIDAGDHMKSILSENGSLTLDGDFTLIGTVEVKNDVILRSGTINVDSNFDVADGIVSNGGSIIVEKGVKRIAIVSGGDALLAKKGFTLEDVQKIVEPDEYTVGKDPERSDYETVLDSYGDGEGSVVIEPSYDLWLGSTRVTPVNKDDIFGDGRAKFNPHACSLYLNDPQIEGKAYDADGYSAKIYSNDSGYAEKSDLTIRGRYRMDPQESLYNGLTVFGSTVSLEGDFAFYGRDMGIYAVANLDIRSGRILGVAKRGEGIGAIDGIFVIRNDVERVEARSEQYRAIFYVHTERFYLDDEIVVIAPENASFGTNSILDGSGQEAKTVVFKNKNIPDYILGDVDGDGEVTIIDATYIQRRIAGLSVKSYHEIAADVDGDGEVTIVDATYIQRYIAGLSAPDGIGRIH